MLALDPPTTEGLTMADMSANPPPGVLTTADVARIWTEEARKQYQKRAAARVRENAGRQLRNLKLLPDIAPIEDIKPNTVLTNLRNSQRTPFASGRKRRYADHPVPAPAGRMGVMPWWKASQEQALRDWFTTRPGRGHGTGGWQSGNTRRRRQGAS